MTDMSEAIDAAMRRIAGDLNAAAKSNTPLNTGRLQAEFRKLGCSIPISTATPPTPVPWHRRARWAMQSWWYYHGPRVHAGPCDHSDCI